MVRGSLRKEGSFILVAFHGHGRPWSLGGAAARGEVEEKSVREWSGEKKNGSKGRWSGRPSPFYRGRGVAASFIDWWRWVAGLGKRYLTQAEFICGIGKGQGRRGFPR